MELLKKIISYPLSILYYLVFGIGLLFFHAVQWLGNNIFGYKGHKFAVDFMYWGLIKATHILGTRYKAIFKAALPKNVPLIFVSNHQSLYDINRLALYVKERHPKFVSKKELGKGIPSVSYNLTHGGSVLIDRKDGKKAILEIKKLGEYITKYKRSAVIFAEGTRSKTGKPKPFKRNGLRILCKYAPDAYIVPVTINNSYKMTPNGKSFPLGIFNKLEFLFHEPIAIKGREFDELIDQVEETVVGAVRY
jgi:1-acyl-sn-glycerol-3-phosphate acyltransferase